MPDAAGLETVQSLFGQILSAGDTHATSVQIIDRTGKLVWRTYELPAAEDIVALLERIS